MKFEVAIPMQLTAFVSGMPPVCHETQVRVYVEAEGADKAISQVVEALQSLIDLKAEAARHRQGEPP